MLENLQNAMAPFLAYLGEYVVLQALAILLLSWVAAWLLDLILLSTNRLMSRVSTLFDGKLIKLIRRPVFGSVILIGLAGAISLFQLAGTLQTIIFSLIVTIALLLWTIFVVRLTKSILRQLSESPTKCTWLHSQTLPLFENLAYITIFGLSVYYVFSAWDVDMTAWLASAGIVGIAVGFAAKDTLANLFSGVFILADAPYKIGDFVVLEGGERGEITKIGLRSTRLLTRDDIEVTVPNSVMGNTKIINESGGPHEKYRIPVRVGVAYGSDIDLVRDILMEIALAEEAVCADPEPRVRFRQFGASSLDFELLCWIDQPVLRGRILDRLNSAVYKRFIQEGVEIPYSKQDVYIKELPSKGQN